MSTETEKARKEFRRLYGKTLRHKKAPVKIDLEQRRQDRADQKKLPSSEFSLIFTVSSKSTGKVLFEGSRMGVGAAILFDIVDAGNEGCRIGDLHRSHISPQETTLRTINNFILGVNKSYKDEIGGKLIKNDAHRSEDRVSPITKYWINTQFEVEMSEIYPDKD